MTGLVRKATYLSACGLMLAGAAMAGVPSAANSSAPCILLMDLPNTGVNPGICQTLVPTLKVIVRDGLGNLVAGSDVVLDFSACPGPGSSAVMTATVPQDPLVTEACAGRTYLKTTNANGEACFTLEGTTNVALPIAGTVCCKIYASGVLLGTRNVIINKYDLNGSGVVNAGDGSLHLTAQGAAYSTLGDYNCSGSVNAGDGSLHLDAQGNQGSPYFVYSGTYCP